MMLMLILVMVVVVMAAYGVWMAGELGVGPRLGRSDRRRAPRPDADGEGDRRYHDHRELPSA